MPKAPTARRASPARLPSSSSTQAGRALGWSVALVVVLAAGGAWWWHAHSNSAADGPAGAASGAAGRGGFGGGRFGPANRTQPVSVQTVKRQDVRVMVGAIGTITANNTAVIQPQVTGVLQALLFKEGQQVKAGQVLAQIDPRSFQAALDQAVGGLLRDKALLDSAVVDQKRYKDLLAKDAIPSQQYDTQVALVRQYEGTVKLDQASVDSARLNLSYTKVTAPIAGRVGLKQVDLGNVVQPGLTNGIVTIAQTHPIALIFAVPSAQLPQIMAKLHANQSLPVEAFDRNGTQHLATGRVADLDNAIDPTTDTVKLKALFPNADDALFPNQAVSVRLQVDTVADALVVPPAAVLRGSQGFYVYVVNADNSVTTRVITPGAIDGDMQAVTGPLKPGEQVVTDGVDRLRDGAKVQVIPSDIGQRASAAAGTGGGGHHHSGAASAGWGASAPASGTQASDDMPPWFSRLPPDVQEAFKKMTPAEREAWIAKRRAERQAQSSN